MEASELRIGNWILSLKVTSKFEPHQIGKAAYIDDIKYDKKEKYYKPISLTEEWLNKFGFEKRGISFDNGVIEIEITVLDNSFYFKFEGMKGMEIKVLKYVHQLQNLFHSLTGEELTIKETV